MARTLNPRPYGLRGIPPNTLAHLKEVDARGDYETPLREGLRLVRPQGLGERNLAGAEWGMGGGVLEQGILW